ncbi:hypothetical protein [Neorhizobium galegae]|uniref:Uncharacterized protein n=1 Tax=Neorhizobium galegae bv. officinalis TaxID=323656 RepID=A0A0T7H1I6_NEOGA|nr:hypothetical protein [Neorhizobium galegae]CDZ53366.1 Hypothetical protein NGAL_HAMBI1189_49590 [Neorhizobium galegae bv. officinalis]
MSTSEVFTNRKGPCPCGKGEILEHVDSPDNPWSRVSYSYAVSCPKCSKEWHTSDGRYLSNISDEQARRAAFQEYTAAVHEVEVLVEPLIDAYLDSLSLKSMAAEHRRLQMHLVMPMDIIAYRKQRNAGKTPSQIASPVRNPKWLLELSDRHRRRSEVEPLLKKAEMAEMSYEALKVRTIPISS